MNDVGLLTKASWLLLIHQLPAKPAYARVKVWRRLQALGAVTVKNAVYALPSNEETQEDFAWLAREIVELGGEVLVCEAALVEGLDDPAADRDVPHRAQRGLRQAGRRSARPRTPSRCRAKRCRGDEQRRPTAPAVERGGRHRLLLGRRSRRGRAADRWT